MKGKEILLEKNDMTLKLEKVTKQLISKEQMSRSELFKKKSLQEKGITLIALVVTIIILLILAGVTLNMALSNNGLFSKTQEAADKYKKAQEDEELEIEKIEYAVDGKEITEVETISNKEEFDKFKNEVNEGKDFNNTLIKLTDDLDLSGETWEPIGTKEHPFKGVFNGNGHEIKNLVLGQVENGEYALGSDGASWIGLFGHNEGIIKNVGIESVSINADGVDGYGIGILAGCNEGKIEMCYNNANVKCESSLYTFGGIVGDVLEGRYY